MKRIVRVAVLIMTIVSLNCVTVSAKGIGYQESDNGITVSLGVDKDSYKAGEAISYILSVDNNKEYWRIKSISIQSSHDSGLKYMKNSEYSYSEMIESGSGVKLCGGLFKGEEEPQAFEQIDLSQINFKQSNVGQEETSAIVNNTWIVLSAISVILMIVFIIYMALKKKKRCSLIFLTFVIAAASIVSVSMPVQAMKANPEISIRPYVKVMYGNEEITVRFIIKMELGQEKQMISASDKKISNRITCHDPSIFKDTDGTYYVFGSFLATGSSTDLNDWKSNDEKLQSSFTEETKTKIRAWNKDEKSGSWNGYLWAPDVIYNKSLQKYCMYLSANGDDWKSNIVMLTSDNVYGPYEYVDSIVYGGFDADTFTQTDAPKVLGTDIIPDRYVKNGVANNKWGDEYPNCIDPCTFYDDQGNLWMSYGSWSGGIFILKLDPETGLRDYNVTYETNEHSDAYFGTKIAGGKYVSGEASYIQKIGDYYFLFISYGALEARGGYNIRVFRSTRPDGDYVDILGNSPLFDEYVKNHNMNVGDRLFGGYKWRHFQDGEVAQGHNSAFVDDDGRAYIVFHTRTTNNTEYHYVKVHQLFLNKEGWIVAAPFMTDGEKRNSNGYTMKELSGKYEFIMHELDLNYEQLDTNRPKVVYLNEDGSITGSYEGTWSVEPGTDYITFEIDGYKYSGITLEMNMEKTTINSQVITAVGIDNQINIWGYSMQNP